jgi:broad specificity phosphatase PhoE
MIYLIRHGQSTFNRYGDTSRDVPLTPDGERQAREVSLNVNMVVCSILSRARQTLAESKISFKHLIHTDLCREEMNGNPINYIDKEDVISEESFIGRMVSLKSMLVDLEKIYGSVAVITHHGVIHALTGIECNNCGIVMIR